MAVFFLRNLGLLVCKTVYYQPILFRGSFVVLEINLPAFNIVYSETGFSNRNIHEKEDLVLFDFQNCITVLIGRLQLLIAGRPCPLFIIMSVVSFSFMLDLLRCPHQIVYPHKKTIICFVCC